MLKSDEEIKEPHVHVVVDLDNGSRLIYQDACRFGRSLVCRRYKFILPRWGWSRYRKSLMRIIFLRLLAGAKFLLKPCY